VRLVEITVVVFDQLVEQANDEAQRLHVLGGLARCAPFSRSTRSRRLSLKLQQFRRVRGVEVVVIPPKLRIRPAASNPSPTNREPPTDFCVFEFVYELSPQGVRGSSSLKITRLLCTATQCPRLGCEAFH
jgi:hypothetical protein